MGKRKETIDIRRLWETVLNPPKLYATFFQHSFYLQRKNRTYKIIHSIDMNPKGQVDNRWYVIEELNARIAFGIQEMLIKRAKEIEREIIRKTLVETE